MSDTTTPAPAPPGVRHWSMRRARAFTGTPDRTARDLVARGLLPRSDLADADVTALLCLSAALALPGSPGVLTDLRDETVAALARAAAPDPGLTLLLTDTDARLAPDPDKLAALLAHFATVPRLLLPVGAWAAQVAAADPTRPGNQP